jgi:gas vesicle protein
VPAYDPSQGGPESLGYNQNPAYTGSRGFTEPPVADPYATAQPAAGGNPYVKSAPVYTTPTVDQPEAGTSGESTTDVAKGEAAAVKDTAVEAGKEVAATAKDEAANVASEAKYQAKSLLSTATSELQSQASTQQSRLASTLRGYADELQGLAQGQGSAEPGVITDLVQQAASKGSEIASWLENREPGDVLEELRRFARRRPVMFLALCGLAGVVAGRITRGAVAANTSVDSPSPARAADYDYSTTGPTTGSLGYEQPAPTYGSYSDAPAGYAGDAGWSQVTNVPAGYPDQGEPTR